MKHTATLYRSGSNLGRMYGLCTCGYETEEQGRGEDGLELIVTELDAHEAPA